MNNSPFLHSEKQPEPNEEITKILQNLDGQSDSDNFLNDITSSNPELIYLIDLQTGDILYFNKEAEGLFGYEMDYIYQNGVDFLQKIIHPDDYKVRNMLLQTANNGIVIENEARLKMKDGNFRLFKIKDRIIKKSTQTNIWQCMGEGTDISEKDFFPNVSFSKLLHGSPRSRFTLKEKYRLLLGIANAIPDILFVLNLDTKCIIYANKQLAQIFGCSYEQIANTGQPILDIIYEEDKAAMIKYLDDMKDVQDGEIMEIEYRMKNKDGSLHWFIKRSTILKRNSDSTAIEQIGIAQDITLRKNQEEKINKSLKILQQSEELVKTGSWDYDIRTKKISWSDGMYTLFEIEKGGNITPSVYLDYAVLQDKPIAVKIVQAIEDTHEPFSEIIRIQVNGEVKTIKIKSGIFKDDKEKETTVVGVDIDITAAVLTEMQIKELNHNLQIKNRGLESANADLKAFNSLAATNYRQTLQKLYTSMEYLVTNDARNLTNEGRANIRRAQSSIQKMKLMTEDIINLSKLHTLDTQLAKVDLNETLEQVITSMHEKITETKALINYPQMPVILGHSTLISLLFHHLLDNALKFRRQNVILKIDLNRNVIIQAGVTYTVISITDNGIGIEQENVQDVFTMFFRHADPSFKGSGIGLAVCKKIMDIHDGFITANTNLLRETTFSCYFPVIQKSK